VSRPRQRAPLAQAAAQTKRRALLDAAATLLVRRGPEGFNVRAVAQAVGASTMVVYTLFGGRDELLGAVCRDSLERLAAALERVGGAESLDGLGALALAYRRFALRNREYYHALAASGRSSALVRESRAFGLLVDCVRRLVARGVLVPADPEEVTDALWALVHGMVSLELGGHFASARIAEARFRAAGRAMLRGWAVRGTLTPRARRSSTSNRAGTRASSRASPS
jgi:AcrR family transcriptional regulator